MENNGNNIAIKTLEIARELTFNAISNGATSDNMSAEELAKQNANILAGVYSTIMKAVAAPVKE